MTVINLRGVSKSYVLYNHALDRLREVISGRKRHQERVALRLLDLEIGDGEVVGLIGRNGAGKSTLLKLVANTLMPSTGEVQVNGQVSALLELGTGFHPDMSGVENVFLGGAVKGLSRPKMEELYPGIVEFSGLADVMDQPVKTYSSGMLMRLAFAVATCVEPEVLIIDEALSVGDAAFSRKSFERIMGFKRSGKTILFCSHSMYQVEAICSRVVWLHEGALRLDGEPGQVITAYTEFLGGIPQNIRQEDEDKEPEGSSSSQPKPVLNEPARIIGIKVFVDGKTGRELDVHSRVSQVSVTVRFVSDLSINCPRVALSITGVDGRIITSAGNWEEGLEIRRDQRGESEVTIRFPKFALLKGTYGVNVFLLCEDGIRPYDIARMVAELKVRQQGLEQGIVSLPRTWTQGHV